jgi:hypothetical protein
MGWLHQEMQAKDLYGDAKKNWMTIFLFKEFKSLFKRIVTRLGGNRSRSFILNSHGSHVTLKAIEQTCAFRLDLVTLQSCISRALQLLQMSCFKPFKTTFRKERDNAMIRNRYFKLNKIKLIAWVDPTLDKGLFKKISNLDLKLQ